MNFVKLTPNLLISDADFGQASLVSHAITHVLDLSSTAPDIQAPSSISSKRKPLLGIRGEAVEEVFQVAQDFVQDSASSCGVVLLRGGKGAISAERNGLVHIESRLLAVAASCLIPEHSLPSALKLIQVQAVSQLCPNSVHAAKVTGASAFILQALAAWETRLRKETAPSCELETLGALVSYSNTAETTLAAMPWRTGEASTDAAESSSVIFNGHRMELETQNLDPRMVVIKNLLTAEEADALIHAASSNGFKQSLVATTRQALADGAELSEDMIQETGRTSTSSTVKRTTPVAAAAISRAAFLAGFSPFCSEALQVVHYDAGQKYDLHNDWFDPSHPYYADRMRARGQRIVSVFCYLTDVEGGGCTYFPKVDKRFKPKKGSAVLWFNQDVRGQMDERVLHTGEEVTAGDKWGANIWIRERPPDKSISAIVPRDAVGRIQLQDGLGRLYQPRVVVPQ